MKYLSSLLSFALLTVCLILCRMAGATPFFIQMFNADGSVQTNASYMSTWPPQSTFTSYGTNIIFGGVTITNQPNASGFCSNWAYPGMYKVTFPALNSFFYAHIIDTTQYTSLAFYATNLPVTAGGFGSYAIVTNWLGFPPMPNTYAALISALGYTPATNSQACVLFLLGYTPATNSYAGICAALGFFPATNNYSGISNAVGFVIATNAGPISYSQLPYTPPTNSYAGISNVLQFVIATNGGPVNVSQLPYVPATNNGAINNSQLSTNVPLTLQIAPWIEVTTNFGHCTVLFQTNGNPGTAATNLPPGTFGSNTNGAFFVLSNLTWNLH